MGQGLLMTLKATGIRITRNRYLIIMCTVNNDYDPDDQVSAIPYKKQDVGLRVRHESLLCVSTGKAEP